MERQERTERRKLPRHVDGRLMVLMMPIKVFLIWVVLTGLIVIFTWKVYEDTNNPLVFMGATLIAGTLMILMSEANNKETGWDILKANIRYKLEGNLYWTRGDLENDEKTRFTWNQINTTERQETGQKTDF